ncbi:MAG: spore maturation protein [Ruminococcus sp.]|nr:spore maturation protein [Ruminococcus sp.]
MRFGFTALAAPLLIAAVLTAGALRRIDVFSAFAEGAREGLREAVSLLPPIMLTVTAITFAYRSGALGAFAGLISPLLERLGYPPEVVPLAVLRPVSGSGALAVYREILSACGPDSFAGRTATVLMGSTETTFYTIAVYYTAVSFKPGARVFISSLTADAAGFILSAGMVRLFY